MIVIVPPPPGSVLDSRVGTRIYYSAACFTSGAETMGKARVETGRSANVRGPLLLVDLPSHPFGLHEARGRRCVDARDRYSWIGNFLTLFEKEKEDAQFDRFLGCVLKGRVENIWESFDSMEKTRLDRVRSRCGKIGRKIV